MMSTERRALCSGSYYMKYTQKGRILYRKSRQAPANLLVLSWVLIPHWQHMTQPSEPADTVRSLPLGLLATIKNSRQAVFDT
jgi:hypothetical protein